MFCRKVTNFKPAEFKFISDFFSIMTLVACALDVLQGNNVTTGIFLPSLVVIKRSLIELKWDDTTCTRFNVHGNANFPRWPKRFLFFIEKKSSINCGKSNQNWTIRVLWRKKYWKFSRVKCLLNNQKVFFKFNTGLPASTAVKRIFPLGGRILSSMKTKSTLILKA